MNVSIPQSLQNKPVSEGLVVETADVDSRVVDDYDLTRAQQLLRDDKTPQGIRGASTGVANVMRVACTKAR